MKFEPHCAFFIFIVSIQITSSRTILVLSSEMISSREEKLAWLCNVQIIGSCSLFDIIHLSWSSHERRSKHISSHFLMDTNLVIENYCMTLLQLDRRYALFEFKKYKHFCFLHFLTLSIYEHVLRYITTRTNHCFITKKLKLNLTRKCCSNISILYFSV